MTPHPVIIVCAHWEGFISAIHIIINSVAQSVVSVCGCSDVQQINDENCVSVESPLASCGGPLSELSLCLLHEPDSGQPFLCGPQSSGET